MKIWANNRARILITSRCNMNCTYCHNEGQPKNSINISDGLIQRIYDLMSIEDSKLDAISFSGGEALLHPKIFNYIEKLSTKSHVRTLITNGLLIDNNKITDIFNSGITKIRLGVDSITQDRSRPTSLNRYKLHITDIIELLMTRGTHFELNVVLSTFNANDYDKIIDFCITNKISAKFFEFVEVEGLSDVDKETVMHSNQIISFERFNDKVSSRLGEPRFSEDKGEADIIYDGEGFNLRYCHFLCDYGLCYKTGTRIDANGSVYACMQQRGKFWISEQESLGDSYNTIIKAIQIKCNNDHEEGIWFK